MSKPSLSILTLGLTQGIVDSVNKRLLARGIDATSLAITNTASSDAEVTRLASSKNWSGLIIGYGVRQDRKWFERLIQIVDSINPNIPLLNHEGPDDVEDAIERHFNIKLSVKSS